ncbi:MAG: alpha/beta hydrolase [Lachnospiraceae bacterium]|nr:alpha/beta hydrolase [Lachnospiraceae bacterium]
MYTTIDNIHVNYIDEGQGDCILLLHGWGSNIALFDGIMKTLLPAYRVVALDMPGMGQTGEQAASWCVDQYVDFVMKFIEERKITSCAVLCHSFGGRVLLKMNARLAKMDNKPFTITKVVFIDAAGIKPVKTTKQKVSLRLYKMARAFMSLRPLKAMYPDAIDYMRKKRGSADYNSATPIMRETLVKVVNEDLRYLLPEIKVPTLLIWGANDTATPLSDAKIMEQEIPDAGLVVVESTGHFSFLENATLVHSVLQSFFHIK